MNTRIDYVYADAENFKTFNSCIVEGRISPGQIASIMDCLDGGESFIPSQVGLPEMRNFRYCPEIDHCWFTLTKNGFSLTSEPADTGLTVEELVAAFQRAKSNWKDDEMF